MEKKEGMSSTLYPNPEKLKQEEKRKNRRFKNRASRD